MIRAFCMRRQIAAPRDQNPEMADPILDVQGGSNPSCGKWHCLHLRPNRFRDLTHSQEWTNRK